MVRLLSILFLLCAGLCPASLRRDWVERPGLTALANQWGHVLDGYGYTHDPAGLAHQHRPQPGADGLHRDRGL